MTDSTKSAGDLSDNPVSKPISPITVSSSGKEGESVKLEAPAEVSTISPHEVDLPPEVEQAGVIAHKDTIELPPDIKKLGVSPSGTAVPVPTVTGQTTVTLPISDDQVVKGFHTSIADSLHWLAVWCIKKLRKAHQMLKVVHGKIIRLNV